MSNRIFICAAVILVLALLGLLAYDKLEIYDRKTYRYPSEEVYSNRFLAMEHWLKETGHPVRVEKQFTPEKIAAAEEKVVMVESTACSWENAGKIIRPWVEQGGYLVLTIVYHEDNMDENLMEFLSGFGIGIEEIEVDSDETDSAELVPVFYDDICFQYEAEVEIFTIKDAREKTRLVEIPMGEGALTVISMPRFMYNNYLNEKINARLAWRLTGARADGISTEDNAGVVFVQNRRGYTSNSLFGKILGRGNLLPVGISALLVIFIGFWTVIPVFGLVLFEKQKVSRPIRERFIAEIQFLKKYRTLDYYLDVYNREQKIEVNSEKEKEYNYRELINQYRRIFDGTAKF